MGSIIYRVVGLALGGVRIAIVGGLLMAWMALLLAVSLLSVCTWGLVGSSLRLAPLFSFLEVFAPSAGIFPVEGGRLAHGPRCAACPGPFPHFPPEDGISSRRRR